MYFRLNKIACGFKDQASARPSGEKCGLACTIASTAMLPLLAIFPIIRIGVLRHERNSTHDLVRMIAKRAGFSESQAYRQDRDQQRLDCSDGGFPFVQISRLGRSTRRGTPTGVPIDFREVIPQLHTGRQSRPVKSGPVMRVTAECKDGDPPPGLQGGLPSLQPSGDYI